MKKGRSQAVSSGGSGLTRAIHLHAFSHRALRAYRRIWDVSPESVKTVRLLVQSAEPMVASSRSSRCRGSPLGWKELNRSICECPTWLVRDQLIG